jgi:hypothetical protein
MRAHLYCPPPVAGVHLAIHTACPLVIGVVALWRKHQVTRELGITVDGPNTLQYVTEVELEGVISNDQFLALEWRAPRQLVVDDIVQFFWSVI